MTGETLRRNLKCREAPRVPLPGTRPGDRCASVDAIAANGDGDIDLDEATWTATRAEYGSGGGGGEAAAVVTVGAFYGLDAAAA